MNNHNRAILKERDENVANNTNPTVLSEVWNGIGIVSSGGRKNVSRPKHLDQIMAVSGINTKGAKNNHKYLTCLGEVS